MPMRCRLPGCYADWNSLHGLRLRTDDKFKVSSSNLRKRQQFPYISYITIFGGRGSQFDVTEGQLSAVQIN